jgi:hypothetical protein
MHSYREGEPGETSGAGVVANYFATLGVPPFLGKWICRRGEYAGKESRRRFSSHSFWNRRSGSDRNIVGRTITLNGNPTIVVGVMPATFSIRIRGQRLPPDLWILSGDRQVPQRQTCRLSFTS